MTVISTKCSELNRDFRNKVGTSSPDLEVLVRIAYSAASDNENVTGIICPEYISDSGICQITDVHCTYAEGFKDINS